MAPPLVASGTEALLHFHDFDPLPFFEDWRVSCACRCDEITVVHECSRYDVDRQAELVQLFGGARPRIFLLWENSD